MNPFEAPFAPSRVVVGLYGPNAISGLRDPSRIFVSLPFMPWERAEKLIAIVTEHGAVEEWGCMVAPISRCEAIGSALTKAGFDVAVDPDVLAAGRAAGSDRARSQRVPRHFTLSNAEDHARAYLKALGKESHPDFDADPIGALGQVAADFKTALQLAQRKE